MRRIVVRATNWVGDAVMSLPVLRAIRERFPQAHLAVLALGWVADLYGRESFADEVIPYTARRGAKDWEGKWRLAAELRERKFDGAILLQNAFEAALVAYLAGIPVRIGYARDGRTPLLTHAIPVPKKGEIPRHESFYYLELLRRAGLAGPLPEEALIRLEGASAAREAGRVLFARHGVTGPVIGVSPGAAYGTAKRWLPERFAEAAAMVASARAASVALFGSGGERPLCGVVAEAARKFGVPCRNFAGETALGEFIEMAAACEAMLTNDSGAMHIASALGIPTVAVFGATDHVGTGPTGPLARVVREEVECSPCLLRECPIDHRCMTRVSAGRVARTALELLR
ncbi:MAG: lipopolysaccharide heptosyltransferase II [Bryobacterales bacterium]|nr:lipopolysaccharide heptosyltransferase II [Bryobacterales bacterium]